MSIDWTDEQNDAIVADYFAMLADDMAGRSYVKAKHNRLLQAAIRRPRGSIEFKHRNISAVLKGLGEFWVPGYKPAFNFQASLIDAVARWLDNHPDWLTPASRVNASKASSSVGENAALWIGPPPTHSNLPPPVELEKMMEIAQRFDVASRDARNRALGRAGEERVLAHEHASLLAAGRTDLANRIRWVSHVDGDGAGYDIQSFETDGGVPLPHAEIVKHAGYWGMALTVLGALFLVAVRLAGGVVASFLEGTFGMVSKKLGPCRGKKESQLPRGPRYHAHPSPILTIVGRAFAGYVDVVITLAYFETTRAFVSQSATESMTLAKCMLLLAFSGGASVFQLPVLGWFTQIGLVAAAISSFYGAAPEASTACAATLLLVTFLGIVPVGLIWAQFEHVSLRKVTVESEHAG